MAFIHHRPDGTGEAAAAILRPGNAGADTAAEHIALTTKILQQIPDAGTRPGKSILIRTDSVGGTYDLLDCQTRRRLSYSVGFGLNETIGHLIDTLSPQAWTPAYDADREP